MLSLCCRRGEWCQVPQEHRLSPVAPVRPVNLLFTARGSLCLQDRESCSEPGKLHSPREQAHLAAHTLLSRSARFMAEKVHAVGGPVPEADPRWRPCFAWGILPSPPTKGSRYSLRPRLPAFQAFRQRLASALVRGCWALFPLQSASAN